MVSSFNGCFPLPGLNLATVLIASSLITTEAVNQPPPPQKECGRGDIKFVNVGAPGEKLFHIVIPDGDDARENRQYKTHQVRLPYDASDGKAPKTDWAYANVINIEPGLEATLKLKPCNDKRIGYIRKGVELHDPVDPAHQLRHITIDKLGVVDCCPKTGFCEYKERPNAASGYAEKKDC